MKEGFEKNPHHNPEMPLSISANLAGSLVEAINSLPKERSHLGSIDLLLAIASSEGKGGDILRIITQDRHPSFLEILKKAKSQIQPLEPPVGKLRLNEKTFACALSLLDLMQRAREISEGKPIETDDIVLAEVSKYASLLRGALHKVGVPEPIESGVVEISKRIIYQEEKDIESGDINLFPQTIEFYSEISPRERLDFYPRTRITDLLVEAREGKFDDVIIRPKWAAELLNSLETQTITILVTDQEEIADSMVIGLASQLSKDKRGFFEYRNIIMVDPVLIEQTPETAIIQAISSAKRGIMYLPNLNRFLDINHLRAAIAGKEIKIITTLTERQWNRLYDKEIFQRVRPIFPEPPTILETVEIINAKRSKLENYLSTEGLTIKITPEAVETAARLADRYLRQILPPEGAKALLARVATDIKIRQSKMVELHDERIEIDTQIDPEDIFIALQKLTGIEVSPDDPEKFLHMEERLKERVVGQEEAIEVVSDAIRRAKAQLKDPRRPIGAFIFMGPSGVGKTELARTLAWFLFDDEEAMIRLDMSEYQERHQISRMIGAPPGYIGYEEGGQLTEAVREKPYSVIVLDEIEKAHPQVRNAFLQIMEDGRLTDGHGRTVDFRNAVIIMTGNVGSEYFRVESEMGREKVEAAVQEEIKDTFRPEFLNRVDSTLIFNGLTPEHLLQIVDIQMKRENEQLAEQELTLQLTDEAKKFLAKEGYHPEYGARPLRRAIQRHLITPLSKKILAKEITAGDTVVADLKEGKIVFASL